VIVNKKAKAVLLQAQMDPEGSRKLRFPDFVTTAQDGGRLSALPTGRLYPKKSSWYSFLLQAESTPGCYRYKDIGAFQDRKFSVV
jgi:hypothetical protein